MDFGLAASFGGASGREALELDAGGAGTLPYMAPERLRGEPLDARADLYSLGCVLYELLCGRPPFEAPDPSSLQRAHLWQAPPRVSKRLAAGGGSWPEELLEQLDALVLRLLAKDPRERFGYAEDVAAALAELGAEDGFAAAWPEARVYLYRPGFQGRGELRGMLGQRLGELERGSGGLILVGGESGSGKTLLLLEAAREASGRLRVLAGECVPGVARRELRVAGEQQSGGSVLATHNSQLAASAGPLEALRKPLQQRAGREGPVLAWAQRGSARGAPAGRGGGQEPGRPAS